MIQYEIEKGQRMIQLQIGERIEIDFVGDRKNIKTEPAPDWKKIENNSTGNREWIKNDSVRDRKIQKLIQYGNENRQTIIQNRIEKR